MYWIYIIIYLVYSHVHRPVYKFLQYKSSTDYIIIFIVGLVLIAIQHICYWAYAAYWRNRGMIGKKDSSNNNSNDYSNIGVG